MSDKEQKKPDRRSRLADLLIILLCLFGAVFCVNLFWIDLFSTLNSKNEKPVGTIVIKNNVVQRRMASRVIWDRLVVDSPAYLGDLIRTADFSSATLHIESTSIDLDERTLIRIQRSPDGKGFVINLYEGNLSLSTGADGGNVVVNIMGRNVKPGSNTILSASTGRNGVVAQVNKGDAVFINGEQWREIATGERVALNADGGERTEKAAVAIQPSPSARYLKSGKEPMDINFTWNSINLNSGESLRLEIAEDRDFNRIVHVIENLDPAAGGASSGAKATLDAGIWYWRLSTMDSNASKRVISTERFIVTEATVPALLSPVTDSVYRYQNELPQLRFEWPEVEGASSYIVEVSEKEDFAEPQFSKRTASVFLLDSSLGQGTWYWRVLPVFPSVYEGRSAFSPTAFFSIEQGGPDDLALVLPEPVIEQPEPEIEEPPPVQPAPVRPARQTVAVQPAPRQPTAVQPTPREPTPVQPTPRQPEPVPVNISLLSPATGTSLPGLTALRQETVFSWNSDGNIARSRFILSRESDPLQGRPAVEIINPERTVRLNRLGEGVYYWTVEAQSADGLISFAEPRRLQIMPIPLLSAPPSLQPTGGRRIGLNELKAQSEIAFSWTAVQGANAYIFTLYEETADGRRQIINRPPENRTSWTLDINTLGRGTFVWQIEPVNRGASGVIDQRGSIGEGSFIIDIPRPGLIQIEDPGTLYGN